MGFKQTTLDLNGPILSFTLHPVSTTTTNAGIVTFVGIATATFPTQSPINPASNTGSITYRWYDTNGPLSDGTNVTGSATTTLTLSNVVNPTDNGRSFYLKADYAPSAYGISPITVGTARSTGNAVNDPIDSNAAVLTVYPLLSITTQPTSKTTAQTRTETFTVLGESTDGTAVSYQWYINGVAVSNGSNSISGATFTVSGATTTTLSVSSNTIGTYSVTVTVIHPTATNSPLTSDSATFTVVSARQIINFELTPNSGGNATLYSWNLFDQGSYTLGSSQIPNGYVMSFYAPEQDLDVYIDLSANAGKDSGSYKGGQGGKSTIRLTLKKNEEYVITAISQANDGGATYLYKKSRLIAVVGGGGNAGTGGNGGAGGGINVAGEKGFGSGAGAGGIFYSAGTLPSTGIFGSTATSVSPKAGDSIASSPNPGRTLPCPRGDYWYNVGYSACQDLGNIQLYIPTGSVVGNTAVISRGFKMGYGIRNNSGKGLSSGGDGGNGAAGGTGGIGGGGGGGSGYTDGSVTVISTQLGGNTGTGKVVIRSAV